MTYYKTLMIALCLFSVAGIASAGVATKFPADGIEGEKRERVQFLGQALLHARAQSRKKLKSQNINQKNFMQAVHRELEAYQKSLLEVSGGGGVTLTPNAAKKITNKGSVAKANILKLNSTLSH